MTLVAALKRCLPVAKADIPLPDMAVGLYDWALIVDHHKQVASLLQPFGCGGTPGVAERAAARSRARFPSDLCVAFKHDPADLCGKIHLRVQAYLQSGDCYQVNLAQRFRATYQGDEWQAFTRLNASNRAPFGAFIRLDQGAIWSLSPGRFYSSGGRQDRTRPIKGTCRA